MFTEPSVLARAILVTPPPPPSKDDDATDLMGTVLWQKDTQEHIMDIDLSDKKFTEAMGHALLVGVESKLMKKKTADVMLEVLQGPKAAQFMQEGSSLLLADDAKGKLELAQFYQSLGMTANALGAIREAIALGGGDKAQQAYEEMMQEMRL